MVGFLFVPQLCTAKYFERALRAVLVAAVAAPVLAPIALAAALWAWRSRRRREAAGATGDRRRQAAPGLRP